MQVATADAIAPAVTRAGMSRKDLFVSLGLVLGGFLVFLTGMQTHFVSDAYTIADGTRQASLLDALSWYIPTAHTWYRPTTDLVFWVEYQLFGLDPLGYHVFALLCHISSSILIYFLALRLTTNRAASAIAAVVFLTSIHAHEVVWEASDLHNALSGVALLSSVFAYVLGRRGLSVVLSALTLSVDENGLLVLPLVALYELLLGERSSLRSRLMTILARSAPFAAVIAAYLLIRVLAGGIYNETVPCRTPECLLMGVLEYTNRLFVRPDIFLESIWLKRLRFAALSLAIVGALMVMLRPWTWRNWRTVLFSGLWLLGTLFYSWVALWPYIADRFLYVPDMGLALLVGAISAEALRAWPKASSIWRAAAVFVAIVVGLWVLAGITMLWQRGDLWTRAGRQATSILDQIQALVPNPAPGSALVIGNIPDSYVPQIPPGNTGPYLFRNGIAFALRMRYDRDDFSILEDAPGLVTAPGTQVVRVVINGDTVQLVEGER